MKSVIQIRNHHLIINDDDGFNPNLEKRSERAERQAKEGESRKKGRVYFMNKVRRTMDGGSTRWRLNALSFIH